MTQGPCAIVTGAAGGIGREAALHLAADGFRLLLVGRTAVALDELQNRLPPQCDAQAMAADVASPQAALSAVSACMTRWGRLDAVVNNAAVIAPIAALHECDPAEWEEAMRINLLGPFLLTRAALAACRGRGWLTLVNVSSGAAHAPVAGWSAYCASKAGLAMLTRCIHEEYGCSAQVRAIGFEPGRVATPMRELIAARQPARVPSGEFLPAEWAGRAIAWLCGSGAPLYAGRVASLDDALFRIRAGLEDRFANALQAPAAPTP